MDAQPILSLKTSTNAGELSRLLSAAVVSPRFCKQLLTDPETALRAGYQSEAFHLSSEEEMWVLSIRAGNLADFSSEIVKYQSQRVCMPAIAVGATTGRLYETS